MPGKMLCRQGEKTAVYKPRGTESYQKLEEARKDTPSELLNGVGPYRHPDF